MKLLVVIVIVACSISCTTPKKESATAKDSTSILKDSLKAVEVVSPLEEVGQLKNGELTEEKGEWVYTLDNGYSFVSNPYDFDLSAQIIESMLGPEANTTVEEVEGGEDYEAYSISTITFENSQISFYSYPGKHSADIYTDLLPLKNGIKVGMTKQDFIKAMALVGENALKATAYRITDDYGYVKFSFRDDKSYNIYVSYEEGD